MSMSSSPVKRNSMDIIDEYMDNDSEEHEENDDEEEDHDQVVPQTPSFQIFKKANRLKKKIKAIQIASRMTKAVKKPEEEFKKPATEVFKPPDCLVAMISKIQKDPTYRKENKNDESHKKLNAKVASSLFLDKIDMDDINALVENNHAGNYEVETEAKFDSRSGNLILRTKMKLRNDHTKPNFIPSQGKEGEDNMKFLNMIKKTVGRKSGAALLEPLQDHSAHSQVPRNSQSRGYDRKFSNHHVNFEDQVAIVSENHSQGKHKDIHRYDVHPHAAPDHHRLLFPHVECLDGTVKAITHDESFKYFGDEGRVAFFEHYRSMCEAASRITATLQQEGDGGEYSTILSGDFDDHTINTARTVGTVNTVNTAQQRSVVSQRSGQRKDDGSVASSTVKVASVMSKLNQEYYTAFESSVSKDDVKRSIDKQIFNHNSFKRYQLRPYVKPKYTAPDTQGNSNLVQLAPLSEFTPRAESSMSSRSSRVSSRAGSRRSSRRQPQSLRSRAVAGAIHGDQPTPAVVYERNLITRGRIMETDYSCGHPTEEADALNATTPPSPRTKYISGCLRESLHPMPNLILRKIFSTTHNLAHYGIGDKMGCVLAGCLQDLPYLEALSLADNNLTDTSLKHLIRSITGIKTLQNLDLSRNKIDGESSDELAEYVSQEDCPLIRLTLQSADVDDGEADRFVQCLCSNRKLLELDLSNNLLGTAETASTGDASIVTGGASLAEFIKSESCRLQVLKVSWNSIRLRSAVKLTEAVAFNSTLTYLDLSCNLMGHAAGEALGDAIMENRTLRTLLVANNNFTSTACLSMCVGVVENLAMKQLSLNENPIGRAGASMIMQTSIVLGSRVSLTATSCNTITQDERCWYDPAMPCRDYELHLDQPFHRAVAFHLLQTVATHSTLIFGGDITYEPPSGGKANKLKLVQAISTDREKYFDEEQQHIMKGLRLLLEAASNTALGTRLFYEADADNSGRLDKDELQDVLDKIGFEIDTDRLQDILAVFDVDGAGTIDLAEFQSLLKSQHHEAAARIKEMLQYPILALSTNPTEKYVPPRSGVLRCSVVDGFVRKKNFYTITSVDQKYAFQMAKGIGDVLMMTDAVRNSKMRMNEAYSMYRMMYKEVGDKAEVLVKVLPQMMYPHEARQLVSKVTHDERIQLARLKAAFSLAVRPMFGAYNGYYCLDLAKELHRVCFARLLEQSQTINAAKAGHSIIGHGRVGDTSQHGNWTSFRNEFWNGKAVAITAQLFTPMPQSGILEFDFSGGVRPTGGELRLTDRRMCKVLENLAVLTAEDNAEAMHQLHSWRRRAREKSQDGLLNMPMYAMSVEKALEVGRCSDDFYNNLPNRRSINRRANRKEEIKVNFMHMSKTDAVDFAEEMQKLAIQATERVKEEEKGVQQHQGLETTAAEGGAAEVSEEGVNEEGEEGNDEEEDDEEEEEDDWEQEGEEGEGFDFDEEGADDHVEMGEILTSEGESDHPGLLPLSPGATGSGPAPDDASADSASLTSAPESDHQLFMRQKRIKEIRHRLHTLLHAKRGVSKFAKASRFVEAIEEAFQQLWILSRHLALLVGLFKKLFGDISKTKYFGSYCADIVVLLFSRVIDIHNFEIVLEALDARDCACVIGRIGLLNLFNPFKPDVTMELDLRRREERLVAKMIVYLSVDEPGINLNYKRFQWKRELDPIPGWDVTEPWFTEEGLPQHGKFAFTYYSGEGRNRNGCIPNLTLRKALTHMTLIDENEVIDEDAMLPDELVCTAEQHFEENRQVWLTYLVPPSDGAGRRNHA